MFGKKEVAQEIGSLIGTGTTVTGDISFSGGLRVDGVVRGAVRCAEADKGGILVVSENGTIEGEVRASHIIVSGRIQGPVHASVLIELQPKARVQGDVQYRALEMHHGAVVEGLMVHIPAEGRAAPPKLTAVPGVAVLPSRADTPIAKQV
jgi:cytoskeletal protein CcmA (bactofilin family)